MDANDRQQRHLRELFAASTTSPLHTQHELKLPFHWLQGNARNDSFHGRENHLSQIDENLLPVQDRTRSTALVGLGGIGKSQIAAEYLYRKLERYQIVLWLHADTKEKLGDQFVAIARAVGFAPPTGDVSYCCDTVLHWLRHSSKYVTSSAFTIALTKHTTL